MGKEEGRVGTTFYFKIEATGVGEEVVNTAVVSILARFPESGDHGKDTKTLRKKFIRYKIGPRGTSVYLSGANY